MMRVKKKVMSLFLTVALVMGMLLGFGAVAVEASGTTTNDTFIKIVFVDCGRKYFSADSIKSVIDNAAEGDFTHVMLGIGNDGLRFLLDDMSLSVGGTTYTSTQVSTGIHNGNEAYYNFDVDELTEDDMDAILSYAKTKGISVIPMVNTPGHMDSIIDCMEYCGLSDVSYGGSARTVDVTNSDAVAFTRALVKKYADYFAKKGCTYFNIGADEYANDVYTSGSMGFGNLISSGKYGSYITYVNNLSADVKALGMTPMAFNDGIYFNNTTSYGTFDNDIKVLYWSSGWSGYTPMSASTLHSTYGFDVINTHGDYYWVLGKSSWQCSTSKASGFDVNTFQGSTISDPYGACFCIWCDYPGADTDSSVVSSTASVITAFGGALPEAKGLGESNITLNNPFPQGTAGSNSFRIPSLLTLSDGTLVAAADARWNTVYDGGGIDTLTSYSEDNGDTWTYSFGNYLGDNGDTYNGSSSTAFIDPAMVADDEDTVYLLCDLYPYGVALNGSGNTTPSTAVAFDDNGNLKLAASGSSSYSYYLDLDDYTIKNSSGTAVSGYTVDKKFNIKGTDCDTNLFCSDSPYTVVRTGYLYLTKSTDGGKSWSDPELLNLKTSSEMACLVAPGNSIVASDGTIIFPVYSYNGSDSTQRVSFIYSTDSGSTWKRSDNLNYSWGSESECVELSDGTLRFFFRNSTSYLCYADAKKGISGYTWDTPVQTSIAVNSNTQLSACMYSRTIDGKQAVLISCPTGPDGNGSNQSNSSYRVNGKIFVGLVKDDYTMDWAYSMDVPSVNSTNQFGYSSLTELKNGDMAILYEDYTNGWGSGDTCLCKMSYKTYAITEIADGADIGSETDASSERTEESFNSGWKFNLGDAINAYMKGYNDEEWDDIDLPHDYSITQAYTTTGEAESGFLSGGTGWYRKTFTVDEDNIGKTVVLNFDGVYADAYVYCNGTYIGEHHYGYTSFAFDISDNLVAGENVIAVKVINDIPSSRWYSGSGIYRDVTLITENPVHVDLNGTAVTTPDISSGKGTVNINTEIQNDGNSKKTVVVTENICKKGSSEVLATGTTTVTVEAGATAEATVSTEVSSPALWSVESPELYTVATVLTVAGEEIDKTTETFGFRWTEFNSSNGFYLNGEAVKLNGVCLHHDQGALGSAAYTDAIKRQLTIMKDMGVNAIRTSHNPADEDFIELCNEMGILVIEEAFDGWSQAKNGNTNDFSKYFTATISDSNGLIGAESGETWAEFAATSMVKRDKNAPCIILWSIGNEITEGTSGSCSTYPTIANNIISWIQAEDTSRQVTIGDNTRTTDNTSIMGQVLKAVQDNGGVVGFNYSSSSQLSSLHSYWGAIVASETTSATNSRDVYVSNSNNTAVDGEYHLTSYDTSCVSWGKTAHDSIYDTLTNDYVSGEFVWTGFDYLGEPTPYNGTGAGSVSKSGAIPNSSYFGIVDTTGFEKDTYYLYRSQWNHDEDTLHLVTAWDADNQYTTGGKTPVIIYSNAAKVELYRNGTQIGTATRTEHTTTSGHVYYTYTTASDDTSVCTAVTGSGSTSLYSTFNVTYAAGTISAKAYDAKGKDITSDCEGDTSVTTPGTASVIDITPEKTTVSNGELIYFDIALTDANGNFDTTAEPNLSFTLSGNGKILAVDNGDQATTDKGQQASVLTGDTSANIKAYAGRALVIVQAGDDSGNVTLQAEATGYQSDTAEVTIGETSGDEEEIYENQQSVTVNVGKSITITDNSGDYESTYTKDGLNEGIATVAVKGTTIEAVPEVPDSYTKLSSPGSSCLIGYVSGETRYFLKADGSGIASTTDRDEATLWSVSGSGSSIYIKSGSYYLSHSNNSLSLSTYSNSAKWSYYSGTGFYYSSSSGSNRTYYLCYSSGFRVSTSATMYAAAYSFTEGTEAVEGEAYTTITITGVSEGSTSVVVGDTLYSIRVIYVPEAVINAGYTASLTLNDNINVNFKMTNLGSDFNKDKLVVTVDGNTIATNYDSSAKVVTGVLKAVVPRDMGIPLSVVVTYDGYNVKSFSYSICSYCQYVLTHSSTYGEKLCDLCEAVLNYGAWADNFFNGKTDSTVNEGYVIDFDNESIPKPDYTSSLGSTITKASASLELGSMITLNFKVNYSGTLDSSKVSIVPYTTTIADNKITLGTAEDAIAASKITVKAVSDNNYNYQISITDIGASQLSRAYRFTINGIDDFYINYSVYNYCYTVNNPPEGYSFVDSLKTLCKAIYNYGEAAKAYSASL